MTTIGPTDRNAFGQCLTDQCLFRISQMHKAWKKSFIPIDIYHAPTIGWLDVLGSRFQISAASYVAHSNRFIGYSSMAQSTTAFGITQMYFAHLIALLFMTIANGSFLIVVLSYARSSNANWSLHYFLWWPDHSFHSRILWCRTHLHLVVTRRWMTVLRTSLA